MRVIGPVIMITLLGGIALLMAVAENWVMVVMSLLVVLLGLIDMLVFDSWGS